MTLTIMDDLEQGSDEWLEARRGMLTASIIGQLITPKTTKPAHNPSARACVMKLAAERISGYVDPVWVSADMERGTMEEPIARDLYAERYAPVSQTGFMVLEEFGCQLGYSPDGLVGDDGLIEIKSRRPKKQLQTILSDAVPPENMAQCQTGLYVSGREWIDYVSFCGGMPLFVKRVYGDAEWADAIAGTTRDTERAIAEMTEKYKKAIIGLAPTERTNFNQEIVI